MPNQLQSAAELAMAKMPYSMARLPMPRIESAPSGSNAKMRAGVEEGNATSPIYVGDSKNWSNPDYTPQLLRHEMTHQVQNNWPQKIQDALPAGNTSDPYNYGGTAGLKKIGGDPTKMSREQSAAAQQYMQAQNQSGAKLDPIYDTFDQKFSAVPLSVMQPTDPNQPGINTMPRDPGLPTGVAGMKRLLHAEKIIPVDPTSLWKPVADDTSAWKPVEETHAAPEPTMLQKFGTAADNFGQGIGKSVTGAVTNTSELLHKLPFGIGEKLIPEGGLQTMHAYTDPVGTAQKVGRGVGDAAQFLIPGLGEESAGEKAAELLPDAAKYAAPLARIGTQALGSGVVNKAQGGNFSTGAIAGGVGSGAGQAMEAIAPIIAESALNVTGANRMYGRTVGRAVLDDTHGIKPSVIEDSARAKMSELKPQVEQIAADAGQNGARGSLTPAVDSVSQKIAGHTNNRAVNSASELTPLQSFLERDAVTGLPLAKSQSPTGLLRIKRGLDSDFIGNWNPTRNTNNELDAAKSAYGKVANEFHTAAPGTRQLDQRISSLIPVAERANRTTLGAGMVQNALNRFRTPTGAMVGMLGGGEAGYHEHGVPGAFVGAAMGAALPALIGSPEAQMFMARTANGMLPRLAVPMAVGGALQLKRGLEEKPNK